MEGRVTVADLQASPPEVRIGLSRAGVTGVEKAVRMEHAGRQALVAATIDCFVDLDPEQKGVHMSRFPELFEEAIDEIVMGESLLVEELAEHIARHIVERQRACRTESSTNRGCRCACSTTNNSSGRLSSAYTGELIDRSTTSASCSAFTGCRVPT